MEVSINNKMLGFLRLILSISLFFAISVGWAGEERQIDIELADMARKGNVDQVKVLIEKGANPNIVLYGQTAIYYAASSGQSEVICPLIQAGADPDFKKKESGYTPLRIATKAGYAEVVERLIECGADVNVSYKDGMTALSSMLANILVFEKKDFRSLVKLALEKGADPNQTTLEDLAPLFLTIRFSDLELTCLLLEHGADINALSESTRDRLIQEAVDNWGEDNKTVKMLQDQRGNSIE